MSKFDQISMKALYEEWNKSGRAGRYFFRPYIKKESTTNHASSVTNVCMKSTESYSVTTTELTKSSESSPSVQTPLDQTPTDSPQCDSSPLDSNTQFSQTLYCGFSRKSSSKT